MPRMDSWMGVPRRHSPVGTRVRSLSLRQHLQFQPFSERIANVNIDVIHQIRHHDEDPKEKGTYFGEALDKQSELNQTDHFTDFRREIAEHVQTFEQLVHHEAAIVAALKKHLQVPGSMAIPAILDLVVQLARDLQSDFYPYFRDFFNILVRLLEVNAQDVEILENTFTCLSYVFKFLWRYLVKDIQLVYGYFSALFGWQYKAYVRNFAAESFAFLMRKVKDHGALFDFLLGTLKDEPEKCAGVGRLLFEMMKGVKGQFHSCMPKVLPRLLEHLSPQEKQPVDALPWQHVEEAFETTMLSVVQHASKETIGAVWEILMAAISSNYEKWTSSKPKTKKEGQMTTVIERLLRLSSVLAEYKNGIMITEPDDIGKLLIKMLQGPCLPNTTAQVLLDFTSTLLLACHAKMQVQTTSKLIPVVYKTKYPTQMVYNLTRTLFNLPLFEKDVLPALLPYCQSHTAVATEIRSRDLTLSLVTELVLCKCPPVLDGNQLGSADTYMLDFGSSNKKNGFPAYIISLLDSGKKDVRDDLARFWSALICLPHVRPLEKSSDVQGSVTKFILDHLQSSDDEELSEDELFVVSQAMVTMVMLRTEDIFQKIPVDVVQEFLKSQSGSVHVLRLADIYLSHAITEDKSELLTRDRFDDIFPALQDNLSSPNSMVRQLTLRILSSFELPLPSQDPDTVDVFTICLLVETTAATVHDYRDKLRHLRKLEHAHIQGSIALPALDQVPLRYLLGCLFINFNLLWKPIRELISSQAHGMGREAFWEVYGRYLDEAATGAEEALLKSDDKSSTTTSDDHDTVSDIMSQFSQHMQAGSCDGSKADYTNFRLQLWTAMSVFPDVCQPKSRVFVPLLFRFLKNEYYVTDLSVAPTQNLLKQSRDSKLQAIASHDASFSQDSDTSPQKRAHTMSESEPVSKRIRTRSQSSEVDMSETDLDDSVPRRGHRIRTRSQSSEVDVSETEIDDSIPKRGHRIRTRSQSSVDDGEIGETSITKAVKCKKRNCIGCRFCDLDTVEEVPEGSDSPKKQAKSKRGKRDSESENVGKAVLTKSGLKRVRTDSKSSVDGEKSMSVRTRVRTRNSESIDDDTVDEMEVDSTPTKSKKKKDENASPPKMNDQKQGKKQASKGGRQKLGKQKKAMDVDKDDDNEDDEAHERKVDDKDEIKVSKTGKNVGRGAAGEGGFEKTRKAATAALLAHLQVFGKLKDPRQLYMEPQLRKLYFDLLIHKNVGVQKIAFHCIMTYKFKYLTPYNENFERLLDDASFKNEIVVFSVDQQNTIITTEHREELLPVLMRILYGKMFVKTGKGTSGKQHSAMRQSLVFRFLSGCQPHELKEFINLVFAPFQQFITDKPEKLKELKESLDLTKVLPLSRIHGALNSYNLIFKKLGHLLDSYLPYLVRMIVGMAMLSHAALESRDSLAPFAVAQLKSIRQESILRIIQVFEDYDMYGWSGEEIDAVFEAVVWPQLDRLSHEGLYSPTPLLRVLHCFTKNRRYFKLLAKHHHDDPTLTPLPHVMRLLTHKDVSPVVATFIMDMVNNLLQQTPYEAMGVEMEEEGSEVKVIQVNDMTPLGTDENVEESAVGTRLLLPHVKSILKHIEKIVTGMHAKDSRKPDKELGILSRISGFVKDEGVCTTIVNLLLAYLTKKMSFPHQTEEDILTSVHNLLKLFTDCKPFYLTVCKLFLSVTRRNSRNILCDIFWVICKPNEELRNLSMIVRKLNSWDKKRFDEPDYLLRLEGFRLANSLVRDMVTVDTDICMALIYNSCFFITTNEDMSLRDSSTNCLITIVKRVGETQGDDEVYANLIRNSLLVEVKTGLRSKTESVRHEFITILTAIVDTFGDQSAFSTMKLLRDTDVEADFYENIRHIQMHRRTRALRRLIKFLLSNRLSVNALLSYFLPVVAAFIGDEAYKKHSGLVEAAVDAFGLMCRQLPWKHYLHLLKYYLQQMAKKLQNQKQHVKVIVAILDAFHFDLSKSTFNMRLDPKITMETKKPVANSETDASKPAAVEEEIVFDNDEEDKPVPEINEATGDEDDTTLTLGEAGREKQVCGEQLATKIHETIVRNVMGQLNKVLAQKIRSEQEHKLVRKYYAEDDEILRVPIALAMVRLLHNLPQGALERYLPGILLKVCNFLKSRSNDIRNTSRDTLILIQQALGPRFFPFILSELKGILKRGYQRHVLCYTVHALLNHMTDTVRPGDIDVCLASLQEVFNEEIFGEVADEKEVEGIVNKVFEARSSKSYDSYLLMAKFIARNSLINFMKPLKQVLETTHSHRSAKKVQEVLRHVTLGLMDNKDMTLETLLVFVHGLVSQTLPLITEKKAAKVEEAKPAERAGVKPESCLILPQETPRGGFKPKTSKKTNQHVLVEFGLQLLNTCLKKGKIVSTDKAHLQMLDPLVPHLAECLFSKYIKVNADCLRVLCWMLRLNLPSVRTNAKKLANGMFIMLRNYASAGAAKGDNKELVAMAFKAVTVLVRDVKHHSLTKDQLQVLLTFCEEDLHDYSRQSTAFSLLKAILSRKLDVPELHVLMTKVQEMSITAEAPHVQRQCRQVVLQYLMDFPLGKKVKKHLEFYVSQLSYELENGRESALEMMAAFFTTFPQSLLFEYCGLFFIPMAANLVNDDSAKCRRLTALALKSLLEKLDYNHRTNLFKIAAKWFMDDKLRHRVLAAQLCGLFVEVEGARFELRLAEALPLIEQQLEPGKYQQMQKHHAREHDEDHLIYNSLNTLLKVLRECPATITDDKWQENMNLIWDYTQRYLTYPHVWVQLVACQLYGLLFAAWEPDQLVAMETEGASKQYLAVETCKKLKQLTYDFMTQLQSELLNEDIANQIIKNLVFIAKCARLVDEKYGPETDSAEPDDQSDKRLDGQSDYKDVEQSRKRKDSQSEGRDTDQSEKRMDDQSERRLSLPWLVRKMTREAHHEAIHQTKSFIKRRNVFKWMASVCLDVGENVTNWMLRTMLPPLQREINDQLTTQDADLKTLAHEVVELVKGIVGLERFTEVYASSQKHRAARKEERKANKALQAVSNPEVAAKRKIKKNLAKKEAKKRKIETYRPSKKLLKKKYKDFSMKS